MASGAPPTRIGPFESVEDSPFLRMQMRALESDVDELRERTAKFAKDCAKYRDGLEDAYANELNFSGPSRASTAASATPSATPSAAPSSTGS